MMMTTEKEPATEATPATPKRIYRPFWAMSIEQQISICCPVHKVPCLAYHTSGQVQHRKCPAVGCGHTCKSAVRVVVTEGVE